MRTYICLNYNGSFHKLVWMNEDRSGVYVGWYGEVAGSHLSYHVDGTKHFRLANSKGFHNQHKGIPILEIDSYVQVGYQAIPLYPQMMQIVGHLYEKEDVRSTQAFFVNSNLFKEDRVDLDIYILHREKEQEFVQSVFNRHANELHLCAVSSLDYFPNHKVAVIILQPRDE